MRRWLAIALGGVLGLALSLTLVRSAPETPEAGEYGAAGLDSLVRQSVAPVQVEVDTGTELYSYDCWPSRDRPGEAGEVAMVVYLTYPSGIAGYRCDLAGQALRLPAVPRTTMKLAAYGNHD